MKKLQWVLMDTNTPRYVLVWMPGRGPSYTFDLEGAETFPTFREAMKNLISRTYLSGRANETYNTTLVPAQIEEVAQYTANPADTIIEKFWARTHDTKKWEPI